MIPKKLHFIWVGDKSIPEYCLDNINRFKTIYDDYEIKVWNDEDVINEQLIPDFLYEYYINENFPNAFKADILRYLILKKYGGLYFDTDFEPLKKLPEFFLSFNFLGGIQNNGEVAIGFIGSVKEEELITNTINSIPTSIQFSKENNYYFTDQIFRITGPEFFDKIASNYKNKEKYFFFTKEYFYPYWYTEVDRRNEDFKITSPLAYAVHHWKLSWR